MKRPHLTPDQLSQEDLKNSLDEKNRELEVLKRELQIEVALESVRSASLAMHKTEELGKVATVVFEKLKELGMPVDDGVSLVTHIEGSKDQVEWMESPDHPSALKVYMPYHNHPILDDYWQAKEKGVDFITPRYDAKVSRTFFNYIFEFTDYKHTPREIKDYCLAAETYSYFAAFQKNSSIFINDFSGRALSEQEIDVVKRISKVFEQAYVRFLDLQKAEAQAQETEIQLALERVRARAMAMHHSEELKEVIAIIYEQLTNLGLVLYDANIAIKDTESKTITFWGSGLGGVDIPPKFCVSYAKNKILRKMFFDWDQKLGYNEYFLAGRQFKDYWQLLLTETDFKNAPREYIDAGISVGEVYLTHIPFNLGWLEVAGDHAPSSENIEILKRFGSVVGLTYQRFDDIRKAEAQAREAEIQLAMERVRARAMAMHNSEELSEAASLLYQQLRSLGIAQFMECGYVIIDEKSQNQHGWLTNFEGTTMDKFILPLNGEPAFDERYESWKRQDPAFHQVVGGKKLKSHIEFAMPYLGSKEVESVVLTQFPDPTIFYCFNFPSGYLHLITETPLSNEHESLLIRFTRVFEMTYKRFLDLQKAESQAREAQIEAALERVRSRTIGMQRSDELKEAANLLFQQVLDLRVPVFGCGFNIWDEDRKYTTAWMSGQDRIQEPFKVPSTEDIFNRIYDASEREEMLFVEEQGGEALRAHYEYMKSIPVFKAIADKMATIGQTFPTFQIMHCAFFSQGYLMFITFDPVPEAYDIFKRFAKVFEQTYTRFLDLKKAESQAREAQIEAALERVRSRTMAIQKTDELLDVGELLYRELAKLGISSMTSGYALIEEAAEIDWSYMVSPEDGSIYPKPIGIPRDETEVMRAMTKSWKNQEPYHVQELNPEETIIHQTYIAEHTLNFDFTAAELISFSPESLVIQTFNFRYGYIMMIGGEKLSEAQVSIMIRFTKVFEQTYTRFLDLQKAEAQAREAEIQLALERVRARTMAMHKSAELNEVVFEFFSQLHPMGIAQWGMALYLVDEEKRDIETWFSTPTDRVLQESYRIPINKDVPVLNKFFMAFRDQSPYVNIELADDEKTNWDLWLFENTGLKNLPEQVKENILSHHYVQFSLTSMRYGLINVIDVTPIPAEKFAIVQRFTKVFEQTYTRFLDLQKAEAQARESQVEAALERVRSKAMAMHSSQDLADTIGTFYQQLKLFNLVPRRCGVGLLNNQHKEGEVFTWNTTENGESLEVVGKVQMDTHPVLENVYNNWITKTDYHPVLRGNEIKEYYQVLRPQMAFPDYPLDEVHYGYFFMFEEGGVYAWKETPLKDDELIIYKRFTSVLSLTYKRYKDLRDAEARTKEAVKLATLDRVRAEIASMRTVQDLDRITPLIWQELTTLGIPFVRCGVFIMDHSSKLIHTFLSTPDGKAIAAFHLRYDAPGRTSEILSNWMKRQEYIAHWDETDFSNLGDLLIQQGALPSKEAYMKTIPPGGIYLHCLPFLQGMLYVGNTEKLKASDIQLIQSIADAFSTAYARYEDFNKLEAAKQQVDKALVELKQTQQQLVQAEKMASLGELTAGIAHEIQNPLNFVNNFSELNKELIEEVKAERLKVTGERDEKLELEILEDIGQNLEKIHHHGQRASSIVKGMLEHSRTGSKEKQLTDINALADEYLRLSYHGLRAKDKSFNAEFIADLDSSIPKINVISQDIGRVLLNLINNAFYAVSEKSKKGIQGYQPKVTLKTKKKDKLIEIKVSDNADGIPSDIVNKIFQPFFTTKPTGSGTGLGLSLSYDIITMGHNGSLEVDTTEGIGSEFIIQLPWDNKN